MLSRLFIFNFSRFIKSVIKFCKKRWSTFTANAIIPAILVIIMVEVLVHPYLTRNFLSHEVDWTTRYLNQKTRNQPVVVIGDSVGYRIFADWQLFYGRLASLACNQATETAGQFFFLKRFIEKNSMPGAVITCDRTPLSGNLEQSLTENYIQRVFTRWSEIYELLKVKMDPVFSIKMVAYKFLSTFKYRLHIQKKITGFTNSNIYSGMTSVQNNSTSQNSIVRKFSDIKEKSQKESLSQYFLKKILREMKKYNIPVFYLPPPTQLSNKETDLLVKSSLERMEKLKKQFDNLYILGDTYQRYSALFFSDGVHPNSEGLKVYRPSVQSEIENILLDAKNLQNSNIVKFIKNSELLFNHSSDDGFDKFYPISDVQLSINDNQLTIASSGKDPAIVFPKIPVVKKRHRDRIIVEVSVVSTVNTTAKLYFNFDNTKRFSESSHLRHRVQTGLNVMFFYLPDEFKGGWLRFDPGQIKGSYTLNKVEGRIVDAESLHILSKI